MATKKSRKLKKADKALNAAAKVLAKAEKKRDAILAREKAKLDKKLDREAKRDRAKAKDAKKNRSATQAAKPAAGKPSASEPAASKPAAATTTVASPSTSTPAFTASNTVAELREAAKANGIAGYSSKTKAQLLEALK